MNIAKRGGGNVTQIIRTTAEVISNKVETMQEMLTMLQGRRLEQNVMETCGNADNKCRREMELIARQVGLKFIVNTVMELLPVCLLRGDGPDLNVWGYL